MIIGFLVISVHSKELGFLKKIRAQFIYPNVEASNALRSNLAIQISLIVRKEK